MAFATLDQFYTFGLRAEVFARPGRVISSVDPSANVFVLAMHGLPSNAPVRFSATSTSAALPAGLSASTVYYALPTGSDTFQMALTPDGSAVDITDAGTGALQLSVNPEPRILEQLDADASLLQGDLVAFGPLTAPYPLELVQANCHLSAYNLAGTLGLLNPTHPTDDGAVLTARYRAAQELRAQYRAGRRPAGTVDTTTPVEENAPIGWAEPDRCWSNGGFL